MCHGQEWRVSGDLAYTSMVTEARPPWYVQAFCTGCGFIASLNARTLNVLPTGL